MPYIGKSPELGVRTRYYYTVSAGATSVSGSDDNSKSLTFSDGEYVDVYLNGVSLVAGTDYNTTTANTIAGLSAMSANDVVEVVVYDVFSVFSGDISGDLSVGGNLTGADGGALSVSAIKSASGNQTITPDGTSDLIINSDRIKLVGAEGESATLLLGADEQDDAGDSWSIVNGTDNVLSFKNDKSGSSDVTHLSITPHATVTSSVVNVEGILSVAPTSATMVASGQFAVVKEGGSAIAEINSYRNAVGGSALILSHSRGTSQGSYTVLNDNDQMGRITWQGADGSDLVTEGAQIHAEIDGTPGSNDLPTKLVFSTTADGANTISERASIDSSGNFIVNTPSLLGGADRYGVNANTGDLAVSSNAATALYVNRENDDGDLVRLSQDRNTEGNISVSGSTVSYNAFTGSHWSRLSDNSKPTILRGTVLETIDEMCDWYQAEYTIPATTKKDEDGNTIVKIPETIGKDSIALPSGKKVGDTITHTKDGVDYTAKIIQEKDIKHVKCKISDTADSSSVYGVFMAWDNDDDTVNDMYVNALGTAVIRIHKDITVAKGDLVVSNGDGTAKKQSDDIIRSKTIGKVLANIKQETYNDGSYTVPCALYCG